jgi:cysteine-rich repeat protein
METPSNFNFISFPHFSTSYLFETTARTSYQDMAQFGLNIGGLYVNNTGFVNSLQGIMHSAFIRQESMMPASIMSMWLVPRSAPNYPCDYFTGMFNDLGTETNSEFTNLMCNYQTHSQTMTNFIKAPVDPIDGVSFMPGKRQSIQWVKVTEQRAIGIQFWYKGTFNPSSNIVSITKLASIKNAYLARDSSDLVLRTTQGIPVVTFSGANGSISGSAWTFIAISVGWLARNDDFVMCGYIYQSGNYDYGDCSTKFTISTTDMGTNDILYVEFGPGLTGNIKETYVTNHLGTPSIFGLFKTSMGVQRYNCFATSFHIDPHYFASGWGNGYMVAGDASEAWDDLNTVNGDGWDSACNIEPMTVWFSDGTAGVSACGPSWGNGKLETGAGEVCDDGNITPGDGWNSSWAVEIGWTCTSEALKTSECTPIWGDGLKLGSETWDDGSQNGDGWNNQWNGEVLGWYWSDNSSPPPATACITILGDGFRASPNEECDDKNVVSGDGWDSNGLIEPGWSWTDDIKKLSHWEYLCGNSKRDHVDEEWDDGNNVDHDGCTNCKVDERYQCVGGSPTTMDSCSIKPTAELEEISIQNELTIKFSQPIQIISLDSALGLTITGPVSPYKFTYTKKFKDNTTLLVNITMTSPMQGNKEDIYTLNFDTTQFITSKNINLLTETLTGPLHKIKMMDEVVGGIGSSMNSVMGVTFATLIGTNIMFGQSTELMWAFMNIIQIIYFFPLLMLYFPDNLANILTYFSSAKLMIDLPQLEGYKTEIKEKIKIAERIGMTSVNDRYESLEYFSTSILLNGEDIFTLVIQSFIIWVLVFAIRALLFTLQCHINVYEEELEKLKKDSDIDESGVTLKAKAKPKGKKLARWFKNKIKEMSGEYRYNFFLRVIIQLFLETSIISILNMRHMKNENGWQILSTIVALTLTIFLVVFFIWASYFSYKNYYKFKGKPKIDLPEFESMYGQYKVKNLPQALFNSFFICRRLLYACIIIFLPDFPIFQAFSYAIICLPILAYHLVMNPFILIINNIMMNINEITLTICGVFFFIFSKPEQNADKSELLGWVVIGLIMGVVMLNIFVLWWLKLSMTIKDIKEYVQAWLKKKNKGIKSTIQSHHTAETLRSRFRVLIFSGDSPSFYTRDKETNTK